LIHSSEFSLPFPTPSIFPSFFLSFQPFLNRSCPKDIHGNSYVPKSGGPSSRPLAKVVEVAQLDGITYGKTEKQKRMEEIGRGFAELKEFGRRWDHQNVFNCLSSQNKWTWSDWLEHARYGLLDDVPKDIVDTIKGYISLERELLGPQEMRRKKP
jgi:hypothetical protein